jgi:Bifunctional DNA primase/polymerase, N-terminal/CHC2 zinc finger
MKNDMYIEALKLFHLGLKPLPLSGKIPLIKSWPSLYQNQEIKESDIHKGLYLNGKIFSFHNNNIGILTGAISNTIVIDLDSHEAVSWLKKQGEIPKTWLAKTHRGYHIYFNYHEGISSTKIHQKIDILSDRKFVVAPPSKHPEGTIYSWINDPWITKKEDLPKWLHTLISQDKTHTNKSYTKKKSNKRVQYSQNIDWLNLYSRTILNIKGRGKWRNGRCPFHSDQYNSFGFNIETGGYKCFADCGSGSGIQFIQRIYNIPYSLAIRLVNGEDVYIG